MAAIRHKLSARPSSGALSAFSTRGGVVLLKTFASIRPSPIGRPMGWRAIKAKNCSRWRYHPQPYNHLTIDIRVRAIAGHALAKIVECKR
jgi:hypothetical protein